MDKTGQHDDDHLQGNSEGETAIPEGEQVKKEKDVSSSEAEHDDIIKEDEDINELKQQEEFHGESRERSLEPSEPGNALVSLFSSFINTQKLYKTMNQYENIDTFYKS